MKIPFYVYVLIGLISAYVSLVYLPRWEYFDDKFYQGLGLYLTWIIFSLIVGAVFFYFDSGNLQHKLTNLGLFLASEIIAMVIMVSQIKVGF